MNSNCGMGNTEYWIPESVTGIRIMGISFETGTEMLHLTYKVIVLFKRQRINF
jgi:hypothetical protein